MYSISAENDNCGECMKPNLAFNKHKISKKKTGLSENDNDSKLNTLRERQDQQQQQQLYDIL